MDNRLFQSLRYLLLIAILFFVNVGGISAEETEAEETYSGKVVRIPIDEHTVMTKAAFDFVVKTIRKAELDQASAVVLDMNTPGGRIDLTDELILDTLQVTTIPIITFVNSAATSAGSIIALATDSIYMRPVSTIGSALAVTMTGDIEGDMKSKINSKQVAFVRNLALQNGHNPDIAEAFVSRDKKVKIGDEIVHKSGEVLNLNAIDASREIDGKPIFAKGVVDTIEEIMAAEELKGSIITPAPVGMEAFAFWVQSISAVLILIGIAGAWLEMKMPGFGLAGIVSVMAFGLFLFGNYMAGNLAGYGSAVAIAFGLMLLALEIFVFPGTMISAIAGTCFILGGIVTAMIDKVDFEWFKRGGDASFTLIDLIGSAMTITSFAFIGAILLSLLLMRYLPDTKLASGMILSEVIPGMESAPVTETLIGLTGETTMDLRPAGKARVDGKLLDVTADGEWIEKGAQVKIVMHEGSRVVVREA